MITGLKVIYPINIIQSMREKKKYLEGTAQVLRDSQRENEKYAVNVLGKEFIVYPNVFSPKYFNDTEFFAKELPVNKGDEILEIGCGTGIVSIFAAWKGASSIIATDINPDAVKNAMENVRLYNLENRITPLQGDVFGPIKNDRFDVIFWNVPFAYVKRRGISMTERAVYDPGYRSLKKLIHEAKEYLKPGGRLLIGFSSTIGHIGFLKGILKEAGYKTMVSGAMDGKQFKSPKVNSTKVHSVKFRLFEARL